MQVPRYLIVIGMALWSALKVLSLYLLWWFRRRNAQQREQA